LAKAIERLIELDEQELRKHTERAACLSLTDAVIEALPDALVVTDATGKILLFNKRAEFMFGFHRSEMIGQMVERLMPERARQGHAHDREAYSRFDISERSRSMGVGSSLVAVGKVGHEFPVDITLARMVVPSGIYNLASIRFSRKIIEIEDGVRLARALSAGGPQAIEESDAGR
jgi:PAS domain S-box-containing protein